MAKAKTNTKPIRKAEHEFGQLPEGVGVVNVELPVFLGEVPTDRPFQIDQTSIKFLSVEQRQGLNRIFMAVERLGLRDDTVAPRSGSQFPPFMRSRPEAARWVFAKIEQAVKAIAGRAS